jgi:Sec-independent protein translocase protein TatA
MTQDDQSKDESGAGFVDSLRDIQGEYIMLGDLYEKQRSYGSKLSDMMKTLQFEVDAIIPIRPEALGKSYRAAYLVSEAVVVAFDTTGGLTSKPLYTLPPDIIVSVIQECTPELQRLLSEKRRAETTKVRSMERVLKELKKAQSTFKQTKKDEIEVEEEEEVEMEEERPRPQEPRVQKEAEVAPQPKSAKDSFAFRGSFGAKQDIPAISQ